MNILKQNRPLSFVIVTLVYVLATATGVWLYCNLTLIPKKSR